MSYESQTLRWLGHLVQPLLLLWLLLSTFVEMPTALEFLVLSLLFNLLAYKKKIIYAKEPPYPLQGVL